MVGDWISAIVRFVLTEAVLWIEWLSSLSQTDFKPAAMPIVPDQDLVARTYYDPTYFDSRTPTPEPTPEPKTIYDLPAELMIEIRGELDFITRGCLALSCTKFYKMFSKDLDKPVFRYPKIHPGEWSYDNRRTEFLLKLETPQLLFCDACLMLHPRRDFFEDVIALGVPRSCKWPGMIQPCRCIRMSPKKLIDLAERLRIGHRSDGKGSAITRMIPNWHTCQKVGGYPLDLNISLSLDKQQKVVFHYCYSFYLDDYIRRTVVLCHHFDPEKPFVIRTVPDCEDCQRTDLTQMRCKRCKLLSFVRFYNCDKCPELKISVGGTGIFIRGYVEFDKRYNVPRRRPTDAGAFSDVDYNWTCRDPDEWRKCDNYREELEGRPAYHPAGNSEIICTEETCDGFGKDVPIRDWDE